MLIRSKAPLRIGLAGGGTDVSPYCDEYGGRVLNAAINLFVYCTIEPTTNGIVRFEAKDLNETKEFEAKPYLDNNHSLKLHTGVYNRIVKDYLGNEALSFTLTTYSDAPMGSGLGASSTLVVAMLKAYSEWLNIPMGEYDLAHLAYDIERNDLKLLGGKQDQYAAAFGGINFMEFENNNLVIVNPLKVKKWIIDELESRLLLFFTGVSRESAHIISAQVKNTLQKDKDSIQAFDELKESAYRMKNALLTANFDDLAQCLKEGWYSKKKTSSAVSNSHIDEVYEFIMKNGGYAAKVSGAGGGGFMMILCNPVEKLALVKKLEELDGHVFIPHIYDQGVRGWTLY